MEERKYRIWKGHTGDIILLVCRIQEVGRACRYWWLEVSFQIACAIYYQSSPAGPLFESSSVHGAHTLQ